MIWIRCPGLAAAARPFPFSLRQQSLTRREKGKALGRPRNRDKQHHHHQTGIRGAAQTLDGEDCPGCGRGVAAPGCPHGQAERSVHQSGDYSIAYQPLQGRRPSYLQHLVVLTPMLEVADRAVGPAVSRVKLDTASTTCRWQQDPRGATGCPRRLTFTLADAVPAPASCIASEVRGEPMDMARRTIRLRNQRPSESLGNRSNGLSSKREQYLTSSRARLAVSRTRPSGSWANSVRRNRRSAITVMMRRSMSPRMASSTSQVAADLLLVSA